jgi:hypothetical protein
LVDFLLFDFLLFDLLLKEIGLLLALLDLRKNPMVKVDEGVDNKDGNWFRNE